MSLKKILKSRKAQVALEYFLIFTMITLLTLLSFSSFLGKVQKAMQGTETEKGFFQTAIERLTK